ncbi:unnamed protein product [Parnassius mnemosyne]|uniref:Carboxylesterase type B domain-containing protein n=1 Tax=Parnassius mnemosyne TaxID=213953 RepID=A0AAV1KNP3_9NEOP
MKWFLCFTFITILGQSISSDDIISVTIEQGEVNGKVEKTILRNQIYYSFKGLPFALPPIGELRFKPPVKHQGWSGTYEAFVNKPTCFQYSPRTRNGESFGISGSEDCLYLSVFTSDVKRSLPVIVFDYNDGFRSGFNGTRTYSPDFFMEEDVIVVTINHRLGLFGYLTTEDENIPGNNGLRDFILGLQWVKDNIKHFGGDPNRVTLMGNRGGAVLADILLYSHKAKNLFSAVILQSGTSMEPTLFYKEPREAAFRLGELVGINTTNSNTLLEELQKIDANILITKEGEVVDTNNFELTQMAVYPFGPVVEKNNPDAILKFLPDNEMVVSDVPIIIGMNSREGLDLISHFIFEPRLLTDLAQDFFVHVPRRSGFRFDKNSSVYENVVRDIQNFYLEDGYLHYANILEYAVYIGDVLQNYALNHAARKLGKELKSDIYYYMFDFRGLLNENSEYMSRYARSSMEHWGATITDELCYLHLCSRIQKTYKQLLKLLSEQPEIKVLKKMVRLWTNFAKYRDPTPDNNDEILKDFIWQPVRKNNDNINYLHITKKLQMRVNPLGERAKFWDNFIAKYSALAKEGVVSDKYHDEL